MSEIREALPPPPPHLGNWISAVDGYDFNVTTLWHGYNHNQLHYSFK